MNEFLTKIKNIVKENPHLLENNFDDYLYTELISFNLGSEEPLKVVEHLFIDWIKRNKGRVNLKTFVSRDWKYFCQFVAPYAGNIAQEAIKLYIPLDEEHLYEGANRLFDFISKEYIKHRSKIGKKIRNDNVVVRVSNMEEALKVIEFVKNDSYIQEGLMNVNPFTINIDGVGIARDGLRSYNSELCNHLAKFINILVNNNRLDDLNMDIFHEYLESVKDFGDEDLQIITSLLCEVTTGRKLSIDDFKSIAYVKDKTKENNKEEIFKRVVKQTYLKYGMDHTISAIVRFRFNGDDSGFTRDDGVRYLLFKNNITLDDVNNFLSKLNSTSENIIEDYIKTIVDKKEYDYLVDAYRETYLKYGKGQADFALEQFILYRETKYITNNGNARNNLIEKFNYSNIQDVLCDGLNVKIFFSLSDLCYSFLQEMKNYVKRL